jgi:DNA-binding PadR family transcriptional regulator
MIYTKTKSLLGGVMAGLISGRDLMKRWGITHYELLHRFIKKGLIVYNEKDEEVSPQEIYSQTEDHRPQTEKIANWKTFELPGSDADAQKMLSDLDKLYFDEGNVQGIEDAFHLAGGEKSKIKSSGPKKARKHHTEKDRLRARAKASELWAGKYKDYTVPKLIDTQEMIDATLKPNGTSNYSARVVKDWIKDLNPNKPLSGAPKKRNTK